MTRKILSRVGKGFTLIELMMVVATIGILAVIAIPTFVKFQCRSQQSEAKVNLKSIYVAQQSYRSEYAEYATFYVIQDTASTQPNPLGWNPKGGKIRYSYTSTASGIGTQAAFTATAKGTRDVVSGDAWKIDHSNALANGGVNQCE